MFLMKAVMEIIHAFGRYSGLTINWTKSALLELDQAMEPQLSVFFPIPVVTQFRYHRVI